MSGDGNHPQIHSEHATSGDIDSRRSSKRFRFKSRSSKAHAENDLCRSTASSSHGYHSGHHRHHHRHKRRRVSSSPRLNSPAPYDDTASSFDPNVAFRESLFDAMGDDEGAAYWESVYGQPIHTYPDKKRNEETGELEKMSDEEYIAFVRRGMWERSWEGIEADREQKRKDRLMEGRERKEAKRKKYETDGINEGRANNFEREVEKSLRRGLERKEKKMWQQRWQAYESAWENLYLLARSRTKAANGTDDATVHLRNEIVWPVESGRRKDVNPQEIERFMIKTFKSATPTGDLGNQGPRFLSNLKSERVRWHPDKVQQRFGSLNIDEGTLRGVTEVFQVMDRLYNEKR